MGRAGRSGNDEGPRRSGGLRRRCLNERARQGLEPPTSLIRSQVLYPLSYGRRSTTWVVRRTQYRSTPAVPKSDPPVRPAGRTGSGWTGAPPARDPDGCRRPRRRGGLQPVSRPGRRDARAQPVAGHRRAVRVAGRLGRAARRSAAGPGPRRRRSRRPARRRPGHRGAVGQPGAVRVRARGGARRPVGRRRRPDRRAPRHGPARAAADHQRRRDRRRPAGRRADPSRCDARPRDRGRRPRRRRRAGRRRGDGERRRTCRRSRPRSRCRAPSCWWAPTPAGRRWPRPPRPAPPP